MENIVATIVICFIVFYAKVYALLYFKSYLFI